MPDPIYQLIISLAFAQESKEITAYLTEHAGYKTSNRFSNQVIKQILTLCLLPNLYGKYQANTNYRKLVVSNFPFVIFYQIDIKNKEILIAHIFHTSADYRL